MSRLSMLSFHQEISLMEFLADCPLVSKLVGYCQDPVCVLMKYYHLGSLDNWVVKNYDIVRRNRRIKCSIISDISQAISFMHQRQIAHCDIKPQNVLVDALPDKNRFCLTDFGISKILTQEYLASEAFQIRNVRGLTVSYSAPDVLLRFRQKKAVIDAAAEKSGDVYSLGMIMLFTLTQKEPWTSLE
jgi:serine/threonine protein kinase